MDFLFFIFTFGQRQATWFSRGLPVHFLPQKFKLSIIIGRIGLKSALHIHNTKRE